MKLPFSRFCLLVLCAVLALTDVAAAKGADVTFEGVVTLQRPGDGYCFVTTTNGVSWRVEFDPKHPCPYPAGTAVRVEGWLEGETYRYTWRLFGCRVARVDEALHPLPAPRPMTCAELWAHPAEKSPLPRPDWYASRVAVEGRVANFNRSENVTWVLLEDGPYHIQTKVAASVTEPLPEDFELGARVRVTGSGFQKKEEAHLATHDILTRREIQVLSGINEGLTREQIADKLGIGLETVKCHAKSIMTKLGVPSSAAAVGKAYELGIFRTLP